MDYKKDTIKGFIEMIKSRSAMYIGIKNIRVLKAFLDGWLYGSDEKISDSYLLGEFQTWTQSRYKITSSQSWDSIISFYSVDDYQAVDNFFNLWDQFIEERETI